MVIAHLGLLEATPTVTERGSVTAQLRNAKEQPGQKPKHISIRRIQKEPAQRIPTLTKTTYVMD